MFFFVTALIFLFLFAVPIPRWPRASSTTNKTCRTFCYGANAVPYLGDQNLDSAAAATNRQRVKTLRRDPKIYGSDWVDREFRLHQVVAANYSNLCYCCCCCCWCLVGLYVHNQMVVVVVLNKKCKVMNGKMSLFDPALQLSWPMKPAKEKVKENCKNECIKSCII